MRFDCYMYMYMLHVHVTCYMYMLVLIVIKSNCVMSVYFYCYDILTLCETNTKKAAHDLSK